jgi:hypothetical protein
MSTAKRKPLKRDQALNDATSGQFGEEPSDFPESLSDAQNNENERRKAARKLSRNIGQIQKMNILNCPSVIPKFRAHSKETWNRGKR